VTEHRLKTWPQFFQPALEGRKPFEVRVNDRDFKVGDTLLLQEYDLASRTYTGREMGPLEITSMMALPMAPEYVVLGLGASLKPSGPLADTLIGEMQTTRRLSRQLTVAKQGLQKMTGHKLMQVAEPARQLLGALKAEASRG